MFEKSINKKVVVHFAKDSVWHEEEGTEVIFLGIDNGFLLFKEAHEGRFSRAADNPLMAYNLSKIECIYLHEDD